MLSDHPTRVGSVSPTLRSSLNSEIGVVRALLALLTSVAFTSSCADGLQDRVLLVEGTGIVSGFVYLDLNGDSVLGQSGIEKGAYHT
jgi:hypothetical protein